MGQSSAGGGRRNSLGLSMNDIEALLNRIDSKNAATSTQRTFKRWEFRLDRVIMKTSHPGGSVVEIPVICRNLSSGGVGVLHSHYVHPGSEVTVCLESQDGRLSRDVPGVVRRCVHREGKVHEIGIEFSESINVREALGMDAMEDPFSRENIDPEKLEGNVVHVDPSSLDRKIIQHFMRSTNVALRQAASIEEGLELVRGPMDVLLVSIDLEDPGVEGFIKQVKSEGHSADTVLLARTQDNETRDLAAQLGIGATLTKPVGQDLLMRALAEFLLPDSPGGVSEAERDAMAKEAMVLRMRELGKELSNELGANNVESALGVISKIRQTARRGGLESVLTLADQANSDLVASSDLEACIRVLLDLSAACDKPALSDAA